MSNSLFLKALLLIHCILYKHPHLQIIFFVTKSPRSSTIIYVRITVTNPKLYQLQSPSVLTVITILIRSLTTISETIILTHPQSHLWQSFSLTYGHILNKNPHSIAHNHIWDNHSHSPTIMSETIILTQPQSYMYMTIILTRPRLYPWQPSLFDCSQ